MYSAEFHSTERAFGIVFMTDTRFARTADKATNERHTAILKALMQRPDNRKCVDCRKKDPRW